MHLAQRLTGVQLYNLKEMNYSPLNLNAIGAKYEFFFKSSVIIINR